MEVPEEVVNRIANDIRRHYIILRRNSQGVPSLNLSDKWNKYFTAAAELCIEHKMQPIAFVEAQFKALWPWPEVTALATKNAVKRFEESKKGMAVEIAKSVMLQLGAYESLLKAGKDPKKILVDPIQGFDALFIYVTASTYGYDDITSAWYEDALSQYLTSPYYDAVYKEAIPEQLKEVTQ